MSGKQAKKQRKLERAKMKQDKAQPKQKRSFKWGNLAILLLSVISLTGWGFSNGLKSDDNRPSVSETTKSTSVKAYELAIDNEEVTPEIWRSINLEMHKADGSVRDFMDSYFCVTT